MTRMNSSHYSKAAILLVSALVLASVAVPAVAVSVASEDVDGSAEVGATIEGSWTFDTLYQEPSFKTWTLLAETGMNNVTWTVALENPSGEIIHTDQFNGTSFELDDISSDSQYGTVTAVHVTVRGDAPTVDSFTYPENETFLVAEFTQRAGESGSSNQIGEWHAHHFTTGNENKPGSKAAREAIESANASIADAAAAGADVSDAKSSMQNAIDFYELGQFQKAVTQAERADEQATEAKQSASQSAQLRTLALYGGGAIVVLALVGGGIYYWRSQQESYDKLG